MQTNSKNNGVASLLFVCMLSDIFIRPFYSAVRYNARVGIISTCCSLIVVFLLTFIAYKIGNKGTSLSSVNSFCVGILFLISAASVFVKAEQFYRYISTETLPLLFFALMFLIVALYCTHLSQNALFKISYAVGFFCVMTVLFIIISNTENFTIENLSLNGNNDILPACLFNLSFAPEILLFFLISLNSEKGVEIKRFFAVLLTVALVFAGMTIVTELVMGDFYISQSQPFHTLSRLGGISVFKRLDAIFASIWLLAAITKFSAFFSYSAKQLFRFKKSKLYYGVLCLSQILIIGLIYFVPHTLIKQILSIASVVMLFICALSIKKNKLKEPVNEKTT